MNYYRNLCIKYVAGEITDAEKKILESWLLKSAENKKIFEEITIVWEKTKPSEIVEIPDIENEWKFLINRIESAPQGKVLNKTSPKIIKTLFTPAWKLGTAFSIIVLFILSVVFIFNQEDPVQLRLIMTANKEHRNVQLSDGTIVYLNSGSRINFPDRFTGERREVRLSGEAYFAVTKNPKPFVVITQNAKTTVLGTKFNVWARDEKTRVTVKEGLVSLTPKAANNKVLISHGQQSEIIKNMQPTTPIDVNSAYLLGWMENRLTFDKTPLKEIVSELERNYNVQLTIKIKI